MKKAEPNKPTVIVKKKRRVVMTPEQAAPTKIIAKKAEPAPKPKKPKIEPNKHKPTNEILSILAEAYPKLFGDELVPLKIGIHKDLVHSPIREKLSYQECRIGVRCIVGKHKYWRVCVEGATRFDLEGNPAGIVTKDQASYAEQRLSKTLAKTAKPRPKNKKTEA